MLRKENKGVYEFQISSSFEDFKNILDKEEREREAREKRLKLLDNYEKAGRFEDAARICDELGMLEKAGELRRLGKTSYLISASFVLGQNGTISCKCPTCGSSQGIASKSNIVKCEHCGNNYIIPKKVLDML